MDNRTKKELSEFLANELHKNHLNGYWFDGEDVKDVIDEFFEKATANEKKQKLDKANAKIDEAIDEAMDELEKQVMLFQKTVNERSNK